MIRCDCINCQADRTFGIPLPSVCVFTGLPTTDAVSVVAERENLSSSDLAECDDATVSDRTCADCGEPFLPPTCRRVDAFGACGLGMHLGGSGEVSGGGSRWVCPRHGLMGADFCEPDDSHDFCDIWN